MITQARFDFNTPPPHEQSPTCTPPIYDPPPPVPQARDPHVFDAAEMHAIAAQADAAQALTPAARPHTLTPER